jgi:putative ABC transport system permease protein
VSLRRYTIRSMQQRPGRTVLTMLSIVIGVTAAVAVGLGTATTRNAYKQMFAMVTGRATLEVDAPGGRGFEADVFEKVASMPGVVAAAPLLARPTKLSMDDGERQVKLEMLGIDPAHDNKVREYEITAGRQVEKGDELVLEEGFAKSVNLKVNDEVKLLTNRLSATKFKIVGLLRPKTGVMMTQVAMAFMPLDRAQYHFSPRKRNVVDRIQIVTAPNADPDKVLAEIAAILPEGVNVHRPAASTQLMQDTLRSTEQGLTLTTWFSLLMAAFIILNTFLMNVSERRRHLSIMRAIGAKKSQIGGMLLGESIILGVLGTLLGLVLGVVVAFLSTGLIARAFDVQLPRLVEVMTPWPFILGTTFGLVMALVGAVVPAYLAGQVSPLEGMNRVTSIKKWDFTRWFLIIGSLLTIGSLLLIYASIVGLVHIKSGTFAAVALLIGLVLLDTVVLDPQASFVARLLRFVSPVEASMALRQVLRNHMRSALTVAVLFIAGSTGVGMASSIIDSVHDVHDWFSKAITADYVIRAMMPDMATGTAPDLPEELGTELAEKAQSLQIRVEGMSLIQESESLTAIAVAREYLDPNPPPFDLIAGQTEKLREQLLAGEVVIGSVLQMKTSLKVGDKLPLETKDGVQQIPICGVANEYMVGGLAIHMARPFGEQWLGIEGYDGYIIKVLRGDPAAIKPELESIAKKYDVLLMSQADLREAVNQFVSGTEWSLWALVTLGFIVGAFGVVNTLTMNVLEQTRELGLLRIVAMTKRQVRRTILMQALIIGGVGLPPGIFLGVGVAYAINLAMMPSFGHPVEFAIHPRMLIGTLIGALLIVLIAALIPARRATKINVVEALHYE